jgi:trypsin-like peptidase
LADLRQPSEEKRSRSIRIDGSRVAVGLIALAVAALVYLDVQSPSAAGTIALTSQEAASEPSSRVSEVEAKIGRANLRGRMEAALDEAFGGIWFEPSTAQVHVGVTSAASGSLAEAVAARIGLSEVVTETPVDSTWAQLDAAHERLDRRLGDLFARGEVTTSIAPDLNAVKVELGSAVPHHRRVALNEEASAAGVEAAISTAASPRIGLIPQARCVKFLPDKANCDKPIVAGVTIQGPNGGLCSAGPAVILQDLSTAAKSTATYILTAGHCIGEEGGVGKEWSAYDKTAAKPTPIGKAVEVLHGKAVEYDVGVIKVDNPGNWVNAGDTPVNPGIAYWDPKNEVDPVAVTSQGGKPILMTKLCVSGQSSGLSCGGTVAGEDTTVTRADGSKVKELIEMKGFTTAKGTSGAPWFRENSGEVYGTHVGVKESNGNKVFQLLEVSFAQLPTKYQLLTTANEKRKHPVITAGKYPTSISAKGGVAEFTAFGSKVKCATTSLSGELAAAAKTVELTPSYEGCTGLLGSPAVVASNGCKYRFSLEGEPAEGQHTASMSVVCPEGKPGIQFHTYLSHENLTSKVSFCTLTVPPQAGLKTATLTNSGNNVVIDAGAIEGVKVKIHRNNAFCPSTGTEAETASGVYHIKEGLTASGMSGGEAVKIDIGIQ